MKNGFIKVAAFSPRVALAKPMENAASAIGAIRRAGECGVKVLALPELFLSGYTAADLLRFSSLVLECENALAHLLSETKGIKVLTLIGLPVALNGALYNCAAVVFDGELCGIVPKTHLTFSEKRCFSGAPNENTSISLCGRHVTFGAKQLFTFREMPSFVLAAEICNDLWAAVPPSAHHAAAGATVVANLAASPEYSGHCEKRTELIKSLSLRSLCGYVFASAGEGESTTDLVYSGHCAVFECGELLAESGAFAKDSFTVSEIDCDSILSQRRSDSFINSEERYVVYECGLCEVSETALTRSIEKFPFIAEADLDGVVEIQSRGLARRISASGAKTLVIGISGGLDSTIALLVAVRACELCGKGASDVLAVTMPCFGTSGRTRENAEIICRELGVTFKEVDIKSAVERHLDDIGHKGEKDVTFENSQARERTQVLMDLANLTGGIVVGTGDLSELALGFATYNGDHMSMYGVNASVPKTLIRAVVRNEAKKYRVNGKKRLALSLIDIVETPVSPELLPPDGDNIAQVTEDIVGPYELHDFFIYNLLKYGYSFEKILRLACIAFEEEYDRETVKKWLTVFVRRFMTQQFKRSCLPDGPKVTSVSLSPRGEFAMPSDCGYGMFVSETENL
ncbi:MAG: NAD(+) synthase [Clostridia bacterium]|nr:NAD(+) synthase [Clostridia bacterium]